MCMVFSTEKVLKGTVLPIIIGAFTFMIIYGFIPLNVTNDRWILAGYDETDIIQHYAGWLAYRNSDWKFPLGLAENMAVGTGTIISYTDSIPIAAMIFKLFRRILPETFQYFGIYTLLCYILQSLSAFKIIFMKTKNSIYSTIGTILFSFSPILMERALRHTALGSQWLILFSFYFYLKYCEEQNKKIYFYYLLLEVLAIGIHPYFLPMVVVFMSLCVVRDIWKKKFWPVLYWGGVQGITYLFGVIIGVLGSGISVSRFGYGYFSMNINALINPASCGLYTWSSFLKIKPWTLGNYDGFNYLGFGVWIFLIVVVLLVVLLKKQGIVVEIIKGHVELIVASVLLTGFAISNVVTFNDKVVLTIPIPEFLTEICGIFRASSRMFYPVYYMIFFFLIILLWRLLGDERIKFTCGVLMFIVALQLFDLHGCIIEKHRSMEEKAGFDSYINDSDLSKITVNADSVLLKDYTGDIRNMAVWAFKNDLDTYFSVANSGSYDEATALSDKILSDIEEENRNLGRSIVVTSDNEFAERLRQRENIGVYESGGAFFIYD